MRSNVWRAKITLAFLLLVYALRPVAVWSYTGAMSVGGAAEITPLQPFALQVRQIESTLAYLGQPLTPIEQRQIDDAIAGLDEADAGARIQEVLDRHTIAIIAINPESRVQVRPGAAKPDLVEFGTRVFLIKVLNQAGVTARLEVESPNSGPVYIQSDLSAEPTMRLSPADVKERWADISLYDKPGF